MFFIVTFESGDRAIVQATTFAEAERRSLLAAKTHTGDVVPASAIAGVHRLPPQGLWIGANSSFPQRVIAEHIGA